MPEIIVEELLGAVTSAGASLAASEEGLGYLTCSEIQPVIDLMLFAGLREFAERIMLGHAFGDSNGGDVHHHIYSAMHAGKGGAGRLVSELIDAQL